MVLVVSPHFPLGGGGDEEMPQQLPLSPLFAPSYFVSLLHLPYIPLHRTMPSISPHLAGILETERRNEMWIGRVRGVVMAHIFTVS